MRHIPANVLFLLDTGGESSGLGGVSKSTSLTRQVASQLVAKLQNGASMAVMQSGNATEMLQPWTTDKEAVLKTLKNKLISTKRSRISEAIANASEQLKDRPEGARHVVMITDGVDTPGVKVNREEAMNKLIAARATVHIISYTEFVRQKAEKRISPVVAGPRPQFRSDHVRRIRRFLREQHVRLRSASVSGLIRRCAGNAKLMKMK